MLRGQGDKWDPISKARSITASFSLNGVGMVKEELPDLYQENEELKDQVHKLAHQIEFMKTVHMQLNNRHLKPKPGGYFTFSSPSYPGAYNKSTTSSTQTQAYTPGDSSAIVIEDPNKPRTIGRRSPFRFRSNAIPSKSKVSKEKV